MSGTINIMQNWLKILGGKPPVLGVKP